MKRGARGLFCAEGLIVSSSALVGFDVVVVGEDDGVDTLDGVDCE